MADDLSDRAVTAASGQRFGRHLREQRERAGVTLDAIASSTKIKSSLLAALERGDISAWPAGIFQRAFVREYARAIGLAPEPVVAEFVSIFAGDDTTGGSPAGLRLTLASDPPPIVTGTRQTLVTVVEAGALLTLAAGVALLTPAGFAAMAGGVAFLYYGIATAWLGRSPAVWYLKRGLVEPIPASPTREALDRRDRLYLVKPVADADRIVAQDSAPNVEDESAVRRSAIR
jgi:transcriptional regulator with XRE-family HTH domain